METGRHYWYSIGFKIEFKISIQCTDVKELLEKKMFYWNRKRYYYMIVKDIKRSDWKLIIDNREYHSML